MWPLLWKGIVVFTALAFLSSVSNHRPPKSLDSALLLYYCCCCCFLLKRGFIFSVLRKMVQPSGWMSTASSLALCVCIQYTCQTQEFWFSGFKVPPFSFKAQPGIFSEPWPASALPQVPRAAFPQVTLAGSFVWSLKKIPELPCPFLQALSSGASKTQRCEGKTPARGVLHVIWSQKWEQMPTSAFSRASSVFLE